MDKDRIAQMKAEHGRVYFVSSEGKTYYFKAPSDTDVQLYLRTLAGKDLYRASHNLVVSCALEPTGASLAEEFKRLPGLATTLATELATRAGLGAEATSGEL